MAELIFRYGAMNCGKSDQMISTAHNYTENGLKVVTMMPEISMREPSFTTSRAGKKWPIDIATHMASSERPSETDVYREFHQHVGKITVHCVLVDEVNFMSAEQVEALERIAKVDGTTVIAHGNPH